MAATPPPGYTPPPADLPQRGDRATFSNRVDAWVTWFSTVILTQIAAIAANVYANALDGAASAVAAMGYRDTALTYRNAAEAARDTALTYRNAAQSAQTGAETARDAAQNYAAALTATSTTSLVIGVGTKVFTTQAGKQFTANQTLKAVNPTNAAQWMVGTATYSGTTLTLAVTDVNPATSGNTVANWVIGPSGEKGVAGSTGGITGGNLTGALNERQAADVPVSATPDIWSGAGNSVVLSGTGTITGFTASPQAGAKRTLLFSGTATLQQGAGMNVYGGTQTVVAGDQAEVIRMDGAFWVTIFKRDGTPSVGAKQYIEILTSGSIWTVQASSFEVEVQAGGQYGYNLTASSKQAGGAGWCGVKRFRDAVIGSAAVISIGGVGTAGSTTVAPGNGGATSFALSGFTTLSATFTGATGADLAIPGQAGANSFDLVAWNGTANNQYDTILGKGGDSNNGFGGPASNGGIAKPATGYGSGGSGGGGAGAGGCIIIRYFK